ncbi:MAG: LysR substrate-binding domain-containing protein [Anderseniella sp.]
MELDIKSVKLFIRVAAIGAIGRAGRDFGYSPTAASQRIQTLEEALGSKLLNRTTRTVSLTGDGEKFLIHARKIVDGIEDAVTDLQGNRKTVSGELRVTASASFGRRYIAPFVGEFLRDHPGASVNLELSDGVFDIVQHGFDLALRIGTLAPSTLMARKIADNPRILVASPDYIRSHGGPTSAKQLAGHNCLLLGDTRTWQLRDSNGNQSAVSVQGNFTTSYGEAVTEAAVSGTGIALKSRWDIKDQLSAGALVEVLSDHVVEPEWSLWAVRPPGRVISARVQVFTEFIEKKLQAALA